jgi:hypothetical protein
LPVALPVASQIRQIKTIGYIFFKQHLRLSENGQFLSEMGVGRVSGHGATIPGCLCQQLVMERMAIFAKPLNKGKFSNALSS